MSNIILYDFWRYFYKKKCKSKLIIDDWKILWTSLLYSLNKFYEFIIVTSRRNNSIYIFLKNDNLDRIAKKKKKLFQHWYIQYTNINTHKNIKSLQ